MRIDAHQLVELAIGSDPRLGETAAAQWLLVDGRDGTCQGVDQRLPSWLQRLPCPSIMISGRPDELSACFDLVVGNSDEAARLITAIEANPRASAVLAQTLRLTAQLELHAGLLVESLAFATLHGGEEFKSWLSRREVPPILSDQGEPVLLTRSGGTLRLVLNRPSTRNAVTAELRDALFEALSLVALDGSIEQVEISGQGDSFSVGGALEEFGTVASPTEGHMIRSLRLPAHVLADVGQRCIMRLHGACIGSGLEMAAFGGKLIASRNSLFRLPEVAMGLIPGAGGCVSVPRRIGRQRAGWMMMTGARVSARTALEWGLVDALEDE